jgi:hypothetical protein
VLTLASGVETMAPKQKVWEGGLAIQKAVTSLGRKISLSHVFGEDFVTFVWEMGRIWKSRDSVEVL